MRYLGMDTSGSVAAVALYDTEQDLFLSQQSLYNKKTHSQVILPLVERTLQDCGLTAADLDGIAVAVGPGSYTGLRIGVAAVKAMTFALQLPCFGISTLEALAYQAATANGLCCDESTAEPCLCGAVSESEWNIAKSCSGWTV